MVIKASTAVKRLAKEILQLEREKNAETGAFRDYDAAPLEDNLFEWHFTVRGPRGTEFEGGKYHGKIILPQEYPFKPPSIILLTPNGRFSLNKKICLSITGFHPEYWQPAWDSMSAREGGGSTFLRTFRFGFVYDGQPYILTPTVPQVRSVLLAIISMFPTDGDGAVGALYHSERQRRELAKQSEAWVCPVCGSKNGEALPDPKEGEVPPPVTAAEEDERQAPVQIPGLSFAYEGDEAVPRPSSSSSAAPEKSGTESACPGSGSSDPAQGGDEAAACAGRPQPGGRIPGGGCNPEAAAAEADDRRQFDAGRSASPASAAAGEVRPPGGTNPARSQPEQPPDGEAAIRARPFERRTGLRNLHSWALDLVIAVLVCIIAERLARKFYIL